MSSVSAAVTSRISVRQFTAQSVPLDTVREILELASRAPSGGNTQPWHVYVLIGEKKVELTKAVLEKFDNGVLGEEAGFQMYPSPKASSEYMDRRKKLGFAMYELMGIKREDKMGRLNAARKNYEFFDAPVGIMVTVDSIVDKNGWGHVGMFIQTICLLARERGLATCLQEAWSSYSPTVKSVIGIPDSETVWCGIALGYADESAPVNALKSERVPLGNFASFLGTESKI